MTISTELQLDLANQKIELLERALDLLADFNNHNERVAEIVEDELDDQIAKLVDQLSGRAEAAGELPQTYTASEIDELLADLAGFPVGLSD